MSNSLKEKNSNQQKMKLQNKKGSSKSKGKGYTPPSEAALQFMPFALLLVAFFFVLCLVATSVTGIIGRLVKNLLA